MFCCALVFFLGGGGRGQGVKEGGGQGDEDGWKVGDRKEFDIHPGEV